MRIKSVHPENLHQIGDEWYREMIARPNVEFFMTVIVITWEIDGEDQKSTIVLEGKDWLPNGFLEGMYDEEPTKLHGNRLRLAKKGMTPTGRGWSNILTASYMEMPQFFGIKPKIKKIQFMPHDVYREPEQEEYWGYDDAIYEMGEAITGEGSRSWRKNAWYEFVYEDCGDPDSWCSPWDRWLKEDWKDMLSNHHIINWNRYQARRMPTEWSGGSL